MDGKDVAWKALAKFGSRSLSMREKGHRRFKSSNTSLETCKSWNQRRELARAVRIGSSEHPCIPSALGFANTYLLSWGLPTREVSGY